MGALHFVYLVVRTALRQSVDWTQWVIFFAIASVGAVITLVPVLGLSMDMSGLKALLSDPTFYAVVFGSVFVIRLICAPYWLWRDARNETEAVRLASENRGMSIRELIAVGEHTSAIREQAEEMRLQRRSADNIDEHYPDLRIADCPEILELFHNYDNKLSGLLSSGKLATWARRTGDSRHLPIDAEMWVTHRLAFYPKSPGSVPAGINQTFLRSARGDSIRYDICLNASQVRRLWPGLPNIAPTDMKL